MVEYRRNFIIDNLIVEDFITEEKHEMLLVESEDTGRSELSVRLISEKNLCIANADKKKTDILFFRTGKEMSMYKRVDHMIFENRGQNQWKLYLIEMKGSVGEKKWDEIKGKFRASYLAARAVAGMLELEISETVMYTTYEKVQFSPPATMPTARRGRSGKAQIRMKDEWDGTRFGLNFGERVWFRHIPVQMIRNEDGVLVGNLKETDSQ